MSIELTKVKATGDYGSSVDNLRYKADTKVDIPPDDPPPWSRGDGSVNAAYDIDAYENSQYTRQSEESGQPLNGQPSSVDKQSAGLGLQHVVRVADLRNIDGVAASSSLSHSDSNASIKTLSSSKYEGEGCWGRNVTLVQAAVSDFFADHGATVRHTVYCILILGYAIYFAWALSYEFGTESSIRLLWMTMLAVVLIIITLVRDNYGDAIFEHVLKPPVDFIKRHFKIFKWCFIACVVAGYVIFLVVDVGRKRPSNLVSLVGMVVYVLLLFIFSKSPSKVFKWLGDRVHEFMLYSDEGAKFVFGDNFEEHFFAFKVLPIVIFFSSVISVLYYLGTMQAIINKIAWVMQRTLGTTAAESTNAAGNIFIGSTEAPLLIRPMIADMTRSELHAVLTGGYATIAGTVMATYISIGVAANQLISASIMAAPCALAMSKLFYPELQKTKTDMKHVSKMEKSPHRNVIEAASSGASGAIGVVANIAVNIMAFISLLAFINTTLTWMGHRVGLWSPDYPELTFELICSYVLWPCAWVMGVEPEDCNKVAELIGVKTFINEFVAYTQLGVIIDNSKYYNTYNGTVEYYNDDMYLVDANITLYGGVMQDRSIAIATYALCGFANIGMLGTMVGLLGDIAPPRKSEIAPIAVRALIAGTVVSFMNACVAGLLYDPDIA